MVRHREQVGLLQLPAAPPGWCLAIQAFKRSFLWAKYFPCWPGRPAREFLVGETKRASSENLSRPGRSRQFHPRSAMRLSRLLGHAARRFTHDHQPVTPSNTR